MGRSPRRLSGEMPTHEGEENAFSPVGRHLLSEYHASKPVTVVMPPKPGNFAKASQRPLNRIQARKTLPASAQSFAGKSLQTGSDLSKGSLGLGKPRILRIPKKQNLGGQVRKPTQGLFSARGSNKHYQALYTQHPTGPQGAGITSRSGEAYKVAGLTPAPAKAKSRNQGPREIARPLRTPPLSTTLSKTSSLANVGPQHSTGKRPKHPTLYQSLQAAYPPKNRSRQKQSALSVLLAAKKKSDTPSKTTYHLPQHQSHLNNRSQMTGDLSLAQARRKAQSPKVAEREQDSLGQALFSGTSGDCFLSQRDCNQSNYNQEQEYQKDFDPVT